MIYFFFKPQVAKWIERAVLLVFLVALINTIVG